MKAKKGLSTAIAIVVAIVVLLIIALAVIGVTTGALGKLGSAINKAPEGSQLTSTICASQITKATCDLYSSSCEWDETNKKCIPKEG